MMNFLALFLAVLGWMFVGGVILIVAALAAQFTLTALMALLNMHRQGLERSWREKEAERRPIED